MERRKTTTVTQRQKQENQYSGKQSSGTKGLVKQEIGKKNEGVRSEGKQEIGKKNEGVRSEGKQEIGKKNAGMRSEGKQDIGKNAVMWSEGKQEKGKKRAGVRSEGKQDIGKNAGMRSEGKQDIGKNAGMRSEGKQDIGKQNTKIGKPVKQNRGMYKMKNHIQRNASGGTSANEHTFNLDRKFSDKNYQDIDYDQGYLEKSVSDKNRRDKNNQNKNYDKKNYQDMSSHNQGYIDKNFPDNFYQEKKKREKAGKSRCDVFGKCGGCQLLDMPYAEQLHLKGMETAKLLKPFVKIEGMIGMEEPEHYRNKVNAAFTHDRKGKPLSGVYKEGTHFILPIEECLLEDQKADEIIGSIRSLLPSFKIKTYDEDTGYGLVRHVMVRIGRTSGQIMVVLVLSNPILPSKNNFIKALLKLHPEITTMVINVNDKKTSMVLGEKQKVIYGKGYIEDTLCGKTFKISPKSFYQVNSIQTERLYRKAIEYAGLTGRETVLDAYCGIGTIGIAASDKAKQVIGVELNRDAVKDAVINAKINNISNITFYQKDAGEFMDQLAQQGKQIDIVFMDPPRTGSSELFLDSLVSLKPKKVVYVSCNPETLVRDLEYMTRKGFTVKKAVGVDMFPFTRHVECVCLLTKNK